MGECGKALRLCAELLGNAPLGVKESSGVHIITHQCSNLSEPSGPQQDLHHTRWVERVWCAVMGWCVGETECSQLYIEFLPVGCCCIMKLVSLEKVSAGDHISIASL